VGNPPFIGGTHISTNFGVNYFHYLQKTYRSFRNRADLCALFYIRAYLSLNKTGNFSLIATNTIAQGDTREAGLDFITSQLGGIIYWSHVSFDWPGEAGVTVSVVGITKLQNSHVIKILNNEVVEEISPFLEGTKTSLLPYKLKVKPFNTYTGSKLDGAGFIIDKSEAEMLIKIGNNSDVILPFLSGEDVNGQPDQKASRYVINFYDWSEEKARQYKECFAIILERVFPQRQKHSEARTRQNYWLFQRTRSEMYDEIKPLSNVLILSTVSKWLGFSFVDTKQVLSVSLSVFVTDQWTWYSILQSSVHEAWARQYSSTLETRLSYSMSDAFGTFPFPKITNQKNSSIGEIYYQCRQDILRSRYEGLTTAYNRFHNPKEKSTDISHLRELHVEMDNAVAAAYGWSDLDLGHSFLETTQGFRFTITEPARREVLSRLLQLNHERYEEEMRQGLHEKDKKKAKEEKPARQKPKKLAQPKGQMNLLTGPEFPDIAEVANTQPPTPLAEIGSWDRCKCLACDKSLMGFSVAEHTQSVHQGKDPGYRMMGG